MTEAMAERIEREWREKYLAGMTEAAREARAAEFPVYGEVSEAAEREGIALAKVGIYSHNPPEKAEMANPDNKPVKVQRYPRRKAIRSWLKMLADRAWARPITMRQTYEVVTAADRKRRKAARAAKDIATAAGIILAEGGAERLRAMIERARAAKARVTA